MFSVGLTGNIAAGKSTVVGILKEHGATVIEADTLVRELQRPGTPVFEAIAARFGRQVIGADGVLDRSRLRTIALADRDALASLNAIVHPAVRRRRAELMQLASDRGVDIVVNDIPLLFEVLQPNEFDCIVLIDAPANVRLDRMVEQRGLSRAEASRMIDAQMPSELKRRSSDYVIQNDKDLESLRVRTSEVWQLIRERAQPA